MEKKNQLFWCLIQSMYATKLVQGYRNSWLSIAVDKH